MGKRMGIISKKFGIRIGIEKTIDSEWEFGTLIRAGIGIGIGKNIHTIPLTLYTGFTTMTPYNHLKDVRLAFLQL